MQVDINGGMQMKAKEMFEKLGYKQDLQDNYIEYYVDGIDYPYGYYPYIRFNLEKEWWDSNLVGTSIEEELAINKQIEELGWLENDNKK